ncbi:Uncharacterised protein [Mycobacterium tuberculosis]|uniref:Uncharacterized protein n=1 Tax=Mycobacterium tuberculosis TaxID=1773 RepID=A0A655AQV9_MYCTX|nr:Uncharacterised protein [Mycobacterium tuberculosis]CFH64541.1 Uncharacterised protein [Mycobacterium tuberculosis]CFJ47990.1 Uncharacterised protein [Mycobacterium tuberculosis]CKQ44595.1 Uncharacterised protein [Mycobacterium tuberculosis]CKQ97214.1 Uncharacterised protein [Mycobacterium tuberculosis]
MVKGTYGPARVVACAGSQLSLAPPFQARCIPTHWCSGSLTHSPSRKGPRVVSKRNGMVTPAGSNACVMGFQPICWNAGDAALNPLVLESVPK